MGVQLYEPAGVEQQACLEAPFWFQCREIGNVTQHISRVPEGKGCSTCTCINDEWISPL